MELIVNEAGARIDKYISLNTDFARSKISKLFNDGFVTVNGNISKASYKVKESDVILIKELENEEEYIEAEKMDLDIIYEDDDLMVINKPNNLVVHPGSGNKNNTLVNGLMYYTKNLSDAGGSLRAGIVHRLDKDTTGLMLVAKNNKTHVALSEGFKNKTIKREYVALVEGVFPSQNAKINAPIGKCKTNFRKQEVAENGKEAVTNLTVIKRFEKMTLIRLSLETGRTHQIRVHLQYIGYPVFNDPVYNTKPSTEYGQYLHSKSIKFIHPTTKEEMFFEIDLPNEFNEVINKLS